MAFLDELRNARDALRRAEQSWMEREAEIIRLREANAKLKEELHLARGRSEPGSRRVSEDCKVCVYRVEMLKRLDKGGESDKM